MHQTNNGQYSDTTYYMPDLKCQILTCLNASHLPGILHLIQYTYVDIFPLLRTVFELVNFDTFECFSRFLFHLFNISKMFSFEDFFHLGKQKVAQGKIG